MTKQEQENINHIGYIKLDFNESNRCIEVLYIDDNGMSVLARTKNKEEAVTFLMKYQKLLYSGRLLKEDKSVWNKK